jgi:hypothetical protein
MDARVKPAHDVEGHSLSSSRVLFFTCQTANAPPPGIFGQAPGPPALQHWMPGLPGIQHAATCRPPGNREPRARGTPGVPMDPRASTPRDIEACRVFCARLRSVELRRGKPQVRQTQGVPRAVFEACSAKVPGVGRFTRMTRDPPLRNQALGSDTSDGHPTDRPSGPSAHRRSAGRLRSLDRRARTPHLRRSPLPGHRSPPRVWRR